MDPLRINSKILSSFPSTPLSGSPSDEITDRVKEIFQEIVPEETNTTSKPFGNYRLEFFNKYIKEHKFKDITLTPDDQECLRDIFEQTTYHPIRYLPYFLILGIQEDCYLEIERLNNSISITLLTRPLDIFRKLAMELICNFIPEQYKEMRNQEFIISFQKKMEFTKKLLVTSFKLDPNSSIEKKFNLWIKLTSFSSYPKLIQASFINDGLTGAIEQRTVTQQTLLQLSDRLSETTPSKARHLALKQKPKHNPNPSILDIPLDPTPILTSLNKKIPPFNYEKALIFLLHYVDLAAALPSVEDMHLAISDIRKNILEIQRLAKENSHVQANQKTTALIKKLESQAKEAWEREKKLELALNDFYPGIIKKPPEDKKVLLASLRPHAIQMNAYRELNLVLSELRKDLQDIQARPRMEIFVRLTENGRAYLQLPISILSILETWGWDKSLALDLHETYTEMESTLQLKIFIEQLFEKSPNIFLLSTDTQTQKLCAKFAKSKFELNYQKLKEIHKKYSSQATQLFQQHNFTELEALKTSYFKIAYKFGLWFFLIHDIQAAGKTENLSEQENPIELPEQFLEYLDLEVSEATEEIGPLAILPDEEDSTDLSQDQGQTLDFRDSQRDPAFDDHEKSPIAPIETSAKPREDHPRQDLRNVKTRKLKQLLMKEFGGKQSQGGRHTEIQTKSGEKIYLSRSSRSHLPPGTLHSILKQLPPGSESQKD